MKLRCSPWTCCVLISTAAIVSLLFLGSMAPRAMATTRIESEKIYCGDIHKYSRAAVVDGQQVYRQVPAYREILERKLTPRDPDYWPLLRKATRTFLIALRQTCREKGYDLVGEVGSISIEGEPVPEITSDLLLVLEKAEGEPVKP